MTYYAEQIFCSAENAIASRQRRLAARLFRLGDSDMIRFS